ncbi:MAG: class I SAM-dependent methyltransferase [Actinomycetota bacterium]|nr:class I SAM-dependent methyltransferase [Actinomycetota bacterium]MDH5313424.1 class I SAM-dependent methyltransferase [Actinomycetota bacterium]
MKHEGWELARSLGVELDDTAIVRLERFEGLVRERALPMGMVGPSDAGRLRERHLMDSLRAAPHLPERGTVCDLGSGAGFPGLVLAIARPDLRFVLVEVRRNRARFLEQASADLDNVHIHGRRLETFRDRVDMCTARAFASASKSWGAATAILRVGGSLVYWGGTTFDGAVDVPPGVSGELFLTPALARSGPLVIMAQQ